MSLCSSTPCFFQSLIVVRIVETPKIAQPLDAEVAGDVDRRLVVAAISRGRQSIEGQLGAGMAMTPEASGLLFEICKELELTQFELVEAMGATWAVDRLCAQLIPRDLQVRELDEWIQAHREDVGTASLAR